MYKYFRGDNMEQTHIFNVGKRNFYNFSLHDYFNILEIVSEGLGIVPNIFQEDDVDFTNLASNQYFKWVPVLGSKGLYILLGECTEQPMQLFATVDAISGQIEITQVEGVSLNSYPRVIDEIRHYFDDFDTLGVGVLFGVNPDLEEDFTVANRVCL